MDTTGTLAWYLRFRGRLTGPYDLAQLETLRKRGQLSRFHEVSEDRRTWASVTTVLPLFEASSPAPEVPPKSPEFDLYEAPGMPPSQPTPPSAEGEAAEWYYAVNGTSSGPVGITDLKRLAFAGEIGSDALVWRDGMPAWAPARQISGLVFSDRVTPLHLVENDRPSTRLARPGIPESTDSSGTFAKPSQVSGLAIAGLVLGIVWLYGLGSLLAIIFSSIALSQIGRSNGRLWGRGMAIAGLVLGVVGMAILFLSIVGSAMLLGGPSWP